jgi:hypothetical protein
MASSSQEPQFTFEGPATYRIVVQGALDATYSTRLAGMTISSTQGGDGPSQTILVGPLRDQAELRGVLDSLYGLHLPVISVEKIDGE